MEHVILKYGALVEAVLPMPKLYKVVFAEFIQCAGVHTLFLSLEGRKLKYIISETLKDTTTVFRKS